MADPNMADFYKRVARIEKARAKGYGFEASGALGRSYYYRPATRRRSYLWPMIFIVASVFLLKGIMYHTVGAETYSSRIDSLMHGEGVDHVGGWLMQADPLTVWISGKIDAGLNHMH